MLCNIDSRGRRFRIFSGVACSAAALVVGAIIYFQVGLFSWPGAVAVCLLAGGFFQIFEGMKGWCVMRAVGIKTRI